MASKTEICNMALGHLAVSVGIGNIDTEASNEARVCRTFFETVRDAILREFKWPFATVITSPSLVASQPNTEWSYSFRYPADCLQLRRVGSGLRNDTRQSRVPFRVIADAVGKLILCDMNPLPLEYTLKIEDTSLFAPDFTLALSFRLAAYIAPKITAGDPFKLGAAAMANYQNEIGKAQLAAIQEQQDDELPESEFILARGG